MIHQLHYLIVCFLFLALLPSNCTTAVDSAPNKEIDLRRLLDEMLDRSRIAEFPHPEFVCRQASSYNRRSTAPGHPDWFAGADFCQFYGSTDEHGRKEWFMLDVDGPGVLTRWWQTQFRGAGTIRIYLDGAKEPIVEGPGDRLFGGDLLTGSGQIGRCISTVPGAART